MNAKALYHVYTEKGQGYLLRDSIGDGGEGLIFAVPGRPNLVAKIFTKIEPDSEPKIRAMCGQNAPHPNMAWPEVPLFDNRRQFVGFLMTRFFDVVQMHEYFTTTGKDYPVWREAFDMARQIAEMVSDIHAGGFVVGDLNERNILVSEKKRAVLVDCDSMQMNLAGTQYLCHVGRPEYLAPELQDGALRGVLREPHSDNWSLAVLIGQLLFLGRNPFYGGSGNTQPADNVREGRTWLFDYKLAPTGAPDPQAILSSEMLALFQRAFVSGLHVPSLRPSAMEWARAMRQGYAQIQTCSQNGRHDFLKGQSCYWCGFPYSIFFGPAQGRRAAAAAAPVSAPAAGAAAALVQSASWSVRSVLTNIGAKLGRVLLGSVLVTGLFLFAWRAVTEPGGTESVTAIATAATPLRADGVLQLPNGVEGYAVLTLTPLQQQQPKAFRFRLELPKETVTAVAVYQTDQAVLKVGDDYRFQVQTHRGKTLLVAEKPLKGTLEIFP